MKEIARGIKEKRMPDGTPVLSVFYYADEERDPLTPEGKLWLEAEKRKYKSTQDWEKEQEIKHTAGGGERLFADVLTAWGHKIVIDYESGFECPETWRPIGAFDHGRTNPTAALSGKVDFDGNIVLTGEYYQPGLSPIQHAATLRNLKGFMEAEVWADPAIFSKTERESDGSYRAVNELYAENGIDHMIQTPREYTWELTGMERILSHWSNLDRREPSLRIVCPRDLKDIHTPVYGLHNDGCPNLLWELRRARREELTATQLVNRNPTEKIVDKDNHLRDSLKYLVMSLPEPSQKSPEQLVAERLAPQHLDLTSASIRAEQYRMEIESSGRPITLGRIRRR